MLLITPGRQNKGSIVLHLMVSLLEAFCVTNTFSGAVQTPTATRCSDGTGSLFLC